MIAAANRGPPMISTDNSGGIAFSAHPKIAAGSSRSPTIVAGYNGHPTIGTAHSGRAITSILRRGPTSSTGRSAIWAGMRLVAYPDWSTSQDVGDGQAEGEVPRVEQQPTDDGGDRAAGGQ